MDTAEIDPGEHSIAKASVSLHRTLQENLPAQVIRIEICSDGVMSNTVVAPSECRLPGEDEGEARR